MDRRVAGVASENKERSEGKGDGGQEKVKMKEMQATLAAPSAEISGGRPIRRSNAFTRPYVIGINGSPGEKKGSKSLTYLVLLGGGKEKRKEGHHRDIGEKHLQS